MDDRWTTVVRSAQVALIVLAYYLVPVVEPLEGAGPWLRVSGAVVTFVLALGWMTRAIVLESRNADAHGGARLLMLAVGGLVFFALADVALARAATGEFSGLETKTDGLYFALTTLATVGFGDVHADGQVARGLLIVQMVFNLVVLTRAARALSQHIARHAHRPP